MSRKQGQIIARGPRRWLVRVSIGRDLATGTRKYVNRTIRGSFKDAQNFRNMKLQARYNGRLPRPAVITLNQLLDQWLATAAKPRLRPKSYADYTSLLRLYIRPVLGTKQIGDISPVDLQTVYAGMFDQGLSVRTIEYTHAVLRAALGQAVRWSMLGENPCNAVDVPVGKRKEMEVLSVEESRRFLKSSRKSQWHALFALALTTGMRPSEYLALKWSDIDWQRGAVSISRSIQVQKDSWSFFDTKRKRSRRTVKLHSFVLQALTAVRKKRERAAGDAQLWDEQQLLFVTVDGTPLKQNAVKREFRKILAEADLRPLRLYDLRHTATTLAIAAGVSVKVISEQLGHSSIIFTLERYSHVLPSMQDDAAAKVEQLLAA